MSDLTNLTTVDCQVEAAGALTITVGEKKNLVCKIPASDTGAGTTFGAASGAVTSPSPANAGKSIQFINGDAAHPYDVQFIGEPVVNGATVTQSFTSYKVGFKDITTAKLKVDGRDFAITPFRFEVKTVIDAQAAVGDPATAAGVQQDTSQNAMPPPMAGRDEEGTNPNGQVQKQTEMKPFPVVGPEGVAAPWWWWAMWAVVAVAVIGYLVKVFLKYKKNKKHQDEVQATILTPQQKFQQKMRKLESQGYHLQSKYKSFALDLTAIVKSTIGEVLKFAAEDMTTEELLETLQKRHKAFYQSSGTLLKNMMAELDQIKFAKTETSTDRCVALLDDANKIGRALFGGAP